MSEQTSSERAGREQTGIELTSIELTSIELAVEQGMATVTLNRPELWQQLSQPDPAAGKKPEEDFLLLMLGLAYDFDQMP